MSTADKTIILRDALDLLERKGHYSAMELINELISTVAEDARDAARYRRVRLWHPRLQVSYWSGQWWEPLYGSKMDSCVDGLAEYPQPIPHTDQIGSAS